MNLPIGVAGANGKHGGANSFRPVVHAEPDCEQTVSVEVMGYIPPGYLKEVIPQTRNSV